MRKPKSKAAIFDAPQKQKARDRVWDILAEILQDDPNAFALLLPGPRDYETRTAMARGFALDHLILVEENPATMAAHTKEFSKSEQSLLYKPRCGWLSDVSSRLAKQGVRVKAAHLDFCGNLCAFNRDSVAPELQKFIRSNIMEEGLLAVTILRGHEIDRVDNDAERLRRLESCVNFRLGFGTPREAKLLYSDTYYNPVSNSSMLWAVLKISKRRKK